MKTQAPGGGVTIALGFLQAATAEYIDIGGPFKTALQERIQAETIAGHAFWMVCKIGWERLRCSKVWFTLLIEQPDPTRL